MFLAIAKIIEVNIPTPTGIKVVKGLSVIKLNNNPMIKEIVPEIKKASIIILLYLNTNERNKAAPIIDIRDIKAKTEDKKDTKKKEAKAENIIPNNMYTFIDDTLFLIDLCLKPETKEPKAKALESIVPIKAAIKEIDNREDNHFGILDSISLIKILEGSVINPENLKLIPK